MSGILARLSAVFGLICALTLGTVFAAGAETLRFDPRTGRWISDPGSGTFQLSVRPRDRAVNSPQVVAFPSKYPPRTIVIETSRRKLFRVVDGSKAVMYSIGVGREGFEWKGSERVSRKMEWPAWTPPAEMRKREAAAGRILPARMEGGEGNPLGARAIYLGATLYRIHGTNEPWTIGRAVSSGCIRLLNEDVIDLYENIRLGDLVVVR
ncbi:L,D-transpeptidase [Oricola cellulosilytica]|nr:L,D-transpeptidase [Oricola cellulosilytica]